MRGHEVGGGVLMREGERVGLSVRGRSVEVSERLRVGMIERVRGVGGGDSQMRAALVRRQSHSLGGDRDVHHLRR